VPVWINEVSVAPSTPTHVDEYSVDDDGCTTGTIHCALAAEN
jgi:hypothetical protein